METDLPRVQTTALLWGTETNWLVNSFKQTYGNLNNIFSKWNAEFVASEKKRQSVLLANIDGKSLDAQQQDVVVSAEDNTLVLAGAGSGKTLTIAGKVKYLCEVKKVAPSEILLIAFTRKSADEMTERISNRLGIPITATTFHKLGLDTLKKARNESLDVLEDTSKFVNQYFEKELLKQPETVKLLLEYFAYYLHIPANMDNFDSLGEAYAYEKGMDFETIKSKYDRTQLVDSSVAESRESKHTLRGEKVKSLEEVSIANFLFLNGVRYEYTEKYHRYGMPPESTYHTEIFEENVDKDFPLKRVNSSQIEAIGYDAENQYLYIRFNGGSVYVYYNVVKYVYDGFIKADSIGKQYIRNKYKYTRLS